jgi:hypothetical protein
MFKNFLILFVINSIICEGDKITSPHSPLLTYKIFYDDSNCGIMSISAGLVQGGELSKQNQFPWMAVIKVLNDDVWSHLGSGSLVTQKHVIASSASVSYLDDSNNHIPVETDRVKIQLGTTKYDDLSEAGSMEVNVAKIINHRNSRKVQPALRINKLSVITLDREITFTEFIRPICLWPFGDDLSDIVGREAYAVGYGSDHTGKDSLTRKHVRMTITDDEENDDCQNTFNEQLVFKNETKFFCAKSDESEGPCHRDTLLFMKIGANWYLKAISSTVKLFRNGTCNNEAPTLYEDNAQFVPWILNQI